MVATSLQDAFEYADATFTKKAAEEEKLAKAAMKDEAKKVGVFASLLAARSCTTGGCSRAIFIMQQLTTTRRTLPTACELMRLDSRGNPRIRQRQGYPCGVHGR